METCYHETVEKISENESDNKTIDDSRKYLMRQILVCSGTWTSYFCFGLSFGSPTVLIPQIRQEANSTDAVSVVMESWLSSTFNYSGTLSAFILVILARLVGRKLSFLFVCGTSLIAHIIIYYSKTVTQILIGEIIQGPLTASSITISIMVFTEYVSPRYRGVFLTLKSAMFFWGIWVANAIGTFMHWKNIVMLGFVCLTYCLLTALFWPESPYWLANKNKFDDCAASHRWLKGRSRESETELEQLIQSRKIERTERITALISHKKYITMFVSKSFYKPMLLSLSVMTLYHFSGKVACGMYSIDIIKRITRTESTAYRGMLILDGVTVIGMYIGCGLSRILKRRTLLLVSSAIGVAFLFCISFYLYLIHFNFFVEDNIISLSLLTGYSLAISVGPMIMAITILGELVPLKYRSSSFVLLGCYANFLMGNLIKMAPFILNSIGARGLFLIFAILASIFIVINYKVLPETKDKTLLEIQEGLLGKKSREKLSDCLKDIDPNQHNTESTKLNL